MVVIDVKDSILGRFSTVVAKRALLGEKVDLVNCEKAIVTGDKVTIYKKYKDQDRRGTPLKGPYLPKMPDRFIRRAIRGMLPYKQERGKTAFKNVMCYMGVPEKFKDEKIETIPASNIIKSKTFKYITIQQLCQELKR
jgi:large subunit ribosomal protein L13